MHGTGIRLDYEAIFQEIKKIKHARLRAVMEHQLMRYRTFF